jgi:hypothetical protein
MEQSYFYEFLFCWMKIISFQDRLWKVYIKLCMDLIELIDKLFGEKYVQIKAI